MDSERAWYRSRWQNNPAATVVRRRRGAILRAWRVEAGLTVEQVAEALGLQSPNLISALEDGLRDLGAERVLRLAKLYRVKHALMLRVIRTGLME